MLKRLASYLRGYERYAAASPLLVVAETLCELVLPLLMARIINEGIEGNDMAVIWQSGGLMVLVAVLRRLRRPGPGGQPAPGGV